MVEPQATRFWHLALQSGLVDPAALDACWQRIPPAKLTFDTADRRLARQTIEAGLLTLWQAQQILGGRSMGFKIDKYVLLDRIGVGGMGRVYLARDTRLGRRVALKVLSPERMNNPRALARFQREAKVGAQLQHENLVRIYDEGDCNNVRYLVMEFIEGKTVAQLVAENGKLSPSTAAGLTHQVALGLEHAYQKGLIHRDVNPANIMVTRDGTAKLTDLGLAIDLGDDDPHVTRDGATVGTFDYISPEQAKHSRNVDTRSDIYSLGCSLYYMIAGQVPFPVVSLPEKLYAHQLSEPDPLTTVVPDMPQGLEIVIRRMMRKIPDERYPTPLAVALALEPFRGSKLSPNQIALNATASLDLPTTDGASSGVANSSPLGSDADLLKRASPSPDLAEPSHNEIAPPPPARSLAVDLSEGVQELDSAEEDEEPIPVARSARASADLAGPSSEETPGFVLDFGPAPGLSGTSSVARPEKAKATKTERSGPSRRRNWPVMVGSLVATGVVGLGLAIAVRGLFRWIGEATTRPAVVRPIDDPFSPMKGLSKGPTLFVLLPDGRKEPQENLAKAVARVAEGGGEILLGGVAPRPIQADGSLVLAGKVTIRADAGSVPTINVDMPGAAPFLKTKPGAALTLSGVMILVQYHGQTKPAAVIESAGDLELRNCVFVAGGGGAEVRAVRSEGARTTVEDCGFRGFTRPLDLALGAGGRALLKNCLMVWSKGDDRKTGWAVRVEPGTPAGKGTRLLALEHCTIAAGGPIEVAGFSESDPLTVELANTLVLADAMLLWASAPKEFPRAIRWTGKQNRYDVQKVAWVVLPPNGFDGHPDSPTDPKTWEKVLPEMGTVNQSARFAVGPTASPYLRPGDYAVTDKDAAGVGIDAKRVGPSAPP